MASTVRTSQHSGIGLAGALFVAFVVLKLCGVIQWSWWWVTAPLWGTFIVVFVVVFVLFAVVAVAGAMRGK